MARLILPFVLLSVAVAAGAQEPAPVAKPVRVCVAQPRNQTTAKLELPKLRQTFLENLQATKLAKDGAVVLVPIDSDNSDDAKGEVEKNTCEFAVYSRLLVKAREEQAQTNPSFEGTSYGVAKTDKAPVAIFGMQCTVERTSSGMPILIDRQFDTQASTGEKGILKLMSTESIRVGEALGKKLTK